MEYPLINKDYKADAVILAAGDYPSHNIPLSILQEAKYVCCCDGSAVDYIIKGNTPNAIVGDGDSLSEEFKEKYASILHTETEQDYNDLTKATRFCLSKGYKVIVYLGATGKREDHALGNISLLAWCIDHFDVYPVMITNYGYFVPARESNVFRTFIGQQISIFNVNCKKIKSKGLKWDAYAGEWFWQGTLNEAIGNEVELDADGLYLVYRTFESKESI